MWPYVNTSLKSNQLKKNNDYCVVLQTIESKTKRHDRRTLCTRRQRSVSTPQELFARLEIVVDAVKSLWKRRPDIFAERRAGVWCDRP